MKNSVDLVICGPDMSGTSTQIQGTMDFLRGRGSIVRDLRGTEISALFHAEVFEERNMDYFSLSDFLNGSSGVDRLDFYSRVVGLLEGGGTNQDLRVASMVKNNVSTYINPRSADYWIMEEPTKRGAGQVNRVIEQNRSRFGSMVDPIAAAETHSVYRTDEFLRFRRVLRGKGIGIIRSRSEESACYQIFDDKLLPNGISRERYFELAGHQVAFANPPKNLFVVCGPENWTEKDYLELKTERSGGRSSDDHEKNPSYQVLVNWRYATDWLEGLYEEGCRISGSVVPRITRFDIYEPKEKLQEKMNSELEKVLSE